MGPSDEHADAMLEDRCEDVDQVYTDTEVGELQALEVGSVIYLRYDFGTTTELFLRVLCVRDSGEGSTSHKRQARPQAESNEKDIENVQAFKLPREKQVDAFFPHLADAFLGRIHPMSSVTLGLSSRISREDDSVFCTMQSAQSGNDVFFSPLPFADLDEFFTVSDESWNTKSLEGIRDGWICRNVLPPTPEGLKAHAAIKKADSENPMEMFGPKNLLLCKEHIKKKAFRFSSTFPRTAEQLTKGKFRWIKYQKGVLRVIVGRGCGEGHRQAKQSQVLRTWKRSFASLHELLCAVEASWTVPGEPSKPLGITILAEYDTRDTTRPR